MKLETLNNYRLTNKSRNKLSNLSLKRLKSLEKKYKLRYWELLNLKRSIKYMGIKLSKDTLEDINKHIIKSDAIYLDIKRAIRRK